MNSEKPVIVGEFLKYEFSEDELRQRSKDLALAVQVKTQAQEEAKAAAAQFKERIEGADSRIGRLSREINTGWEMRTIDCYVQFHTPVAGTKRIVRTDTGEIVREVAMEPSELQKNLFSEKFGEALEKEFNRPENPFARDGVDVSVEHNGKTIFDSKSKK